MQSSSSDDISEQIREVHNTQQRAKLRRMQDRPMNGKYQDLARITEHDLHKKKIKPLMCKMITGEAGL